MNEPYAKRRCCIHKHSYKDALVGNACFSKKVLLEGAALHNDLLSLSVNSPTACVAKVGAQIQDPLGSLAAVSERLCSACDTFAVRHWTFL